MCRCRCICACAYVRGKRDSMCICAVGSDYAMRANAREGGEPSEVGGVTLGEGTLRNPGYPSSD